MPDQIAVQVKYTVTEGKFNFTDALYYDYNSYPSVPKATIDAQKQARFDAWKIELAKPKPPVDLDAAITEAQKQADYWAAQKQSYQEQKAAQSGGGK